MKTHKLTQLISKNQIEWFMYNISAVVITHAALFNDLLDTRHFGTPLINNPSLMRKIFGTTDAGYYLEAGIQLDSLSKVTSDTLWIFNLWPPGQPIVLGAILRIIKNDEIFGLVLGSLIATTWGVFLGFLAWEAKKHFGRMIAMLFLVLPATVGPLKNWIFGYGMFYAESFSTLFFFVGLIVMIKYLRSESDIGVIVFSSVISSSFFAAAAYFRASFYSIIYVFSIVGIISASILILKYVFKGFKVLKFDSKNLSRTLIFSATAFICMSILMAPWLSFLETKVNGTRDWSKVGEIFVGSIWSSRSSSADFIRDGGVGWACEIDPIKCHEISVKQSNPKTSLTISELALEGVRVIISNPIDYSKDRIKFIGLAWFSNENSGIGQDLNLPLGVALLMGNLFVIFLFFKNSKKLKLSIPLVFPILVVVFLPNLIGHIEVRYLIIPKLLPLLIPLLAENSSNVKSGRN